MYRESNSVSEPEDTTGSSPVQPWELGLCLVIGLGGGFAWLAGRSLGVDTAPGLLMIWWALPLFGLWVRHRSSAGHDVGLPRPTALLLSGAGACGAVLAVVEWSGSVPARMAMPGTNQIAAGLAALLPWWLDRAARGKTRRQRLGGSAAALGSAGLVLALGSRGGLLAALVALGVWLSLERAHRVGASRPGRRAVSFALVALALVAFTVASVILPPLVPGALDSGSALRAVTGLLPEQLLLERQMEGATWSSLLEGRPTIWRRSLFAAVDFPFGLGVGTYGATVPHLYPLDGPAGTHAHSGLLQRQHETGIGGALAWLVLWLHAGRRLLRARSRREARALAATWAALSCFQLLDALPIADGSGLFSALIMAAALSLRGQEPGERGARRPVFFRYVCGIVAGLIVLLTLGGIVGSPLLSTARVILASGPGSPGPGPPGPGSPCPESPSPNAGALWLTGLCLSSTAPGGAVPSWRRLVELSERRVELVAFQRPQDLALSRSAVERHGQSCTAWHWRGHALILDDPLAAERAWLRGSALCPERARLHLDLARLRRGRGALLQAVEAYDLACRHGDPGANACWAGGRLAEQIGLGTETALAFYGRSRLPEARRRAAELADEPPR